MYCWHDHHLVGYSVDGELGTITFKLSWPYDNIEAPGRAQLIFLHVEGYYFEHDLGGNIISAIGEIPTEGFLHGK